MPTSIVALDATQYVRINTNLNPLVLQAHRDSVRIAVSELKPAYDNTAFHMLDGSDAPLQLFSLDTNVWALAQTDTSSLVVTEVDPVRSNFNFEVARGNITGHDIGTIFGRNQDIDPAAEELIWDYGGVETYLTADTEVFLSSDNASDTNVGVFVWGMTDDYVFKQEVHIFTAGQAQQSIGEFFRIFRLVIISGSEPLGNIYCAESDTLIGGMPNTASKVHAFMAQGTNITHKASGTVPVNHTMYVTRLFMGVRRGEDAVIQFRQKTFDSPGFVEASSIPIYQSGEFLVFDPPFEIAEKTSFEFTATTVTNNTQVILNTGYILVDDMVT